MPDDALERYEARRDRLADSHEEGAEVALREAIDENTTVDCISYCYGGTSVTEVFEVLADLAEAGWRIVRADG